MNTEWFTFSKASKHIGKNRNYFSNRYRLNPEYFENNIKIIGGIKFINEDGIKNVLCKIKKVVVLQKRGSFLKDKNEIVR